jgi:SAV_6107-like HEPN
VIPAHALPHRTPLELLTLARRGLAEARSIDACPQSYAAAHLAALRAAAAVLAARARPAPVSRRRITNVWVLLAMVAPELGDWAAFFAAGAAKRSAAESGIAVVTAEEADHLIFHAARFIEVVQEALGFTR